MCVLVSMKYIYREIISYAKNIGEPSYYTALLRKAVEITAALSYSEGGLLC